MEADNKGYGYRLFNKVFAYMDGDLSLISRADIENKCSWWHVFSIPVLGRNGVRQTHAVHRPKYSVQHLKNSTHGLHIPVQPLYTFIWSHMNHTYTKTHQMMT